MFRAFTDLFTSSRHADETLIGHGRPILKEEKIRPIYLKDEYRKRHVWVFGTTGVGKTRLEEAMIEQDIRKGLNVAVLDPKGDAELLSKIIQVARETGRENELIMVNPIFPDLSAPIDPLSHYIMPEELCAHIVSGVSVGKEPYFFNVAYEMSLAIVMGTNIINKHRGRKVSILNLEAVMDNLSHNELKAMKQELDLINTDDARRISKLIDKVLESTSDYFSKVASSLRVALTELSVGNIGRIIGTASENKFIERLEKGERVILIVQLGALMTSKAAYTTGKVVISMVKTLAGRLFASDRKLNPALALYIDEAQNVLFPGFENLLAQAGSAGIMVHGFCQSVSQIYSVLGKDAGNAILDNTNTKIFLRVPDPTTAEYVSKHFGYHKVLSPVIQTDSVGTPSYREMEEEVVKPDKVPRLKNRQFYMMTYDGDFKGKTADVSPLKLRVVFPEIQLAESGIGEGATNG